MRRKMKGSGTFPLLPCAPLGGVVMGSTTFLRGRWAGSPPGPGAWLHAAGRAVTHSKPRVSRKQGARLAAGYRSLVFPKVSEAAGRQAARPQPSPCGSGSPRSRVPCAACCPCPCGARLLRDSTYKPARFPQSDFFTCMYTLQGPVLDTCPSTAFFRCFHFCAHFWNYTRS